MKLKQSPGDFRVFEDLEFVEDPKGRYHVHRLLKQKLGTLEALDRVARAAGVPREAIAYAGLKDRQAVTEQYLSIDGKRVRIDEPDLKLRFVGRSNEQVTSKQSSGNRFRIVVRDLTPFEVARLRRNRRAVETCGLPNYFDDQRFGCLVQGQGFVARTLARGNAEGALRQLIATPPAHDRGGDAKLRRLLGERWGDFEACLQIARGPMYESIFEHLRRHPRDFRGALARVPARLKTIHLFAYQSYLWNHAVSRYLSNLLSGGDRVFVRSRIGSLLCWRYLRGDLAAELREVALPLPDAQTRCRDPRFQDALVEVLDRDGLALESLTGDGVAGFVFKEEMRRLVLLPENLAVLGPSSDDHNRGKLKVELRFKLPRGTYATLVVRRLFADASGSRAPRDGEQSRQRRPSAHRGRPPRSAGGPHGSPSRARRGPNRTP